MKKKLIYLLLLLVFVLSLSGKTKKNYVIIGVPNDVETFNPLFASNITEGNVKELLFLHLVESRWNYEVGDVEYFPMLAKEWEWGDNKKSVIITLRDDIYWSDSVKCTLDDVIFSFDLLSDQNVQSTESGYFENFIFNENNRIDIEKTFEVLSDNRLKINFLSNSYPGLQDIDHPILPKHYFDKFARDKISRTNINNSLVVSGPYKIEKWNKNQSIILKRNHASIINSKNMISKIVFKILPEYQLRINQLLLGEIDLMEDIKTDDIKRIKDVGELNISPISGRDFDYLGWNNIDVDEYQKGVIKRNKFFGSSKVRRALTLAINREVVINEYLSGYGQLANSPISPIFKSYYDTELSAIPFNSSKAIKLLNEEGWKDSNGNEILDKDGVEFEFTLHIPSGNPRREFAASLFQNNLKAIGIKMEIESSEISTFIANLFEKKYDAWMAAWVIPLPINLQISWKSDLETTQFNFASYQNKNLDILLDKLNKTDNRNKQLLYKKIQRILYHDQPYTFLYWIDNIVAYNKRIKNISPSPLGAVSRCWEWEL